eukprot:g2211.t1
MDLVIVRHAQSENNAIIDDLLPKVLAQVVSTKSSGQSLHSKVANVDVNAMVNFRSQFLERRKADPSLTTKGFQQTHTLVQSMKTNVFYENADKSKVSRILFICSPLTRTVLTLKPTLQEYAKLTNNNITVFCHGQFYEVGGLHKSGEGAIPGRNAEQLEKHFTENILQTKGVGLQTVPNTIPDGKGWYSDHTNMEVRKEAQDRIYRRVYLWINTLLNELHERKLQEQEGEVVQTKKTTTNSDADHFPILGKVYDKVIICVHGDLMSILLKTMINGKQEGTITDKNRNHIKGILHGNCGVTTLHFHKDKGFILRSVNDCSHIPQSLQTGFDSARRFKDWPSLQKVKISTNNDEGGEDGGKKKNSSSTERGDGDERHRVSKL